MDSQRDGLSTNASLVVWEPSHASFDGHEYPRARVELMVVVLCGVQCLMFNVSVRSQEMKREFDEKQIGGRRIFYTKLAEQRLYDVKISLIFYWV